MSSLNTVKALLILNAKKGWTDAARKKAALTRKAKQKNLVASKIEMVKSQNERRAKRKADLSKLSATQIDKLHKKHTDSKTGTFDGEGFSKSLGKAVKSGAKGQMKTVKQSEYSRTPAHVPKKGHYVDFFGGRTKSGKDILHGVKLSKGNSDKHLEAARRKVEKALGKKLPVDSRHDFPSFTAYHNGEETGGG